MFHIKIVIFNTCLCKMFNDLQRESISFIVKDHQQLTKCMSQVRGCVSIRYIPISVTYQRIYGLGSRCEIFCNGTTQDWINPKLLMACRKSVNILLHGFLFNVCRLLVLSQLSILLRFHYWYCYTLKAYFMVRSCSLVSITRQSLF